MGDPKATSSSSLPPGCRFYPSEDQLLSYYLLHKNHHTLPLQPPSPTSTSTPSTSDADFYNVIKETNLYNYNPFELPEVTCFRFGYRGRKRHWYCYTERVEEAEEERANRRRAGFGFWKRKGRARNVMGSGGNVIVGRRKCFIFYLDKCNGKTAVRTDWFMYEYALIDNVKASFVVCRVFVKSRGRNSISEHALSSCAEESIATVRHIGIQHDGSTISVLDEDKLHDCLYLNSKIEDQPTKLIEETEPNYLVKPSAHAGGTDMVNSLTPGHLISILEGDFIEMDDLL